MNSNRKTAIIVGALLITATVAYSIGVIFLDPILSSSDYLTKVSENENTVILGALLVLMRKSNKLLSRNANLIFSDYLFRLCV